MLLQCQTELEILKLANELQMEVKKVIGAESIKGDNMLQYP